MEPAPQPIPDPVAIPPLPIATTTLEYESARLAPSKGGLIAMSVIFFCIGGLTGLGLLAFIFFLTRGSFGVPGAHIAQIATGLAIYGAISTAFIWTGVGCCRARRWVRPLILAGAWPWLIMGCVMCLFMSVELLRTESVFALIPLAMAGSMFIGIPGLIVFFFQRRQTAETLWFYDPIPGWADRCPIPVLAFSIWTALGAIITLISLVYGSFPLADVAIIGAVAKGAIILASAAMLGAAVGAYVLKPWAWWLSLAQAIVFPGASLVVALRSQLYHYAYVYHGPVPPATAPTTGPTFVQELQPLSAPWLPLTIILTMLVWIGILLRLRRYFALPPASASPPAA